MDAKDQTMLEALKAIAEGQKQIVDELKKLGDAQKDLVPIRMPDGKIAMALRSSLTASTQGTNASGLKLVEHEPITHEPWPDPNQPKPPVAR